MWMTGLRAVLSRASDQFVATFASVDRAGLESRTACELPVGALVEHVIAGNEFAIRLLAGASADEAQAGIEDIRLGVDPVQQVAISCAAQTDAFVGADRTRPLHHPSGDIDYDTFARFRLGELVVHGWDVAVAAGLDTSLEPETVEDLWRRVAPHLDRMQAMGAYGAGRSDQLPTGASLQQRLLDAFGRRPQ